MPSASAESDAHMERIFGPQGEDMESGWEFKTQEFLEKAGYKQVRFMWLPKPGVSTVDDMEEDEYQCMWWLVTEWDWGMLAPPDLAALMTTGETKS